MQHFQRAAELSLPYAMTAYAMMLMEGIGVSVDVNTAQIWLKKAIELEDPNAQWLLGKIYMEGRNLAGGPRFHEAFDLLHESASKGISQAQHLMALMHEYGLGVPQNFDEAMRWYNEASQNSNIESMYNLALMYTYGRGTDQDFRKASSLFDKAARLNHAASIYYIGLFKLYGYGCEPDYDRALHWFERAVGSTDEEIRKKALMAAKELRALLKIANEKNDAIAEKFRSMSEARGDL
jgi:TPR repeat protein